MAKNSNDKYYTPPEVVKKAIEVLLRYFRIEDISEIIEPSAGDGAFIEEIKKLGKPYAFYDLYPEHPEVQKQDFNELKLGYKPGRIFIGNPPFGNASSLFKRFVKGACEMGDGAVYVGPASHWNAKWGWKGLRLVYSEHLGDVEYYTTDGNGENKKVNTCLNVYMSGEEDMLNRAYLVENDIKITGAEGLAPKGERPEGLYFGFFGDGILGRITTDPNKWRICWKIDILNKSRKMDIMEFLEGFRERYYDEIKKGSPAGAGVSIYNFKQKLAEWLYPTRMERLERDVEIEPLYHKYKENDFDFYLRAMESGGSQIYESKKKPRIGECHSPQKYIPSLGIKVLNKGRYNDIKDFCETFNEKYGGEIIKRSLASPRLNPPILKSKLAEYLYPTREERLERDVEIFHIGSPEYGNKEPKKEYDFLVQWFSGEKQMGLVVKDFKERPKALRYLGIKILNESRRKDIEEFFKSFRDRNADYFKNVKMGGMSNPNSGFLKQKLAEWLYPTREEMLERDVEIRQINVFRNGKDFSYEYYICNWGAAVGEVTNEIKYANSIAVNIKNNNIRNRLEDFIHNIREFIPYQSSTPGFNIIWFKQKLAEWLYPEDEYEDYKFYKKEDLPIKKAKPVNAAIALF